MSTTSSFDRQHSVDRTHAPRPDQPQAPPSDELLVLGADDYRVVSEPIGERHDRHDRYAPTQRVTSARGSHTEDVGRRMRNYAISMGIRTLCVLLAVLAFPNWWAWLFVPGAVVLPYIAVILANAGRERTPDAVAAVAPVPGNLPVLRTQSGS